MGRNDRSGGSTAWHDHQEDFSQCMKNAKLMEIPYTGLRYTWHNSQAIGTIHKKLDWSFGNAAFFTKWSMANSNFLLRSISDNSATMAMLTKAEIKPHPPYKFLNLWVEKEEFLPMVHATWMEEADGHPMLQLTTKL
ncbi:hypothetical protein OIU77_021153 [Salix suchowensis]|uniref:Uncharacterized protein n=1 Tax=Salix suchowensis TaxID=1278906 RepID=A0ABQ9CCQ8_9ROSI|nr:hypothetical protein OIU78_000960 [Salix suchowensis]KAJ6396058.1 hypothetical protein OIU77_021153 [Salix suchowensis]